MLGGIGRRLADNLQKGGSDVCIVRKRSIHIDLHAHQAKGMNDIAELLRRLAVATATQVGKASGLMAKLEALQKEQERLQKERQERMNKK